MYIYKYRSRFNTEAPTGRASELPHTRSRTRRPSPTRCPSDTGHDTAMMMQVLPRRGLRGAAILFNFVWPPALFIDRAWNHIDFLTHTH